MMAFGIGGVTAVVLAALTYLGLQAGTVAMTERFDQPNLHLHEEQLPD
ncbi:hypothetical protein ACOI1H_11650 [Loktanella sp. DJP18]